MNILINASNLKVGGGVQVADSVLRELHHFTNHSFTIILPDALNYLGNNLKENNFKVIKYNLPQTISGIGMGRNKFLDNIVKRYEIEKVFTIFGPSLWRPKVPHLCGFARPQIIYKDSPFFKKLNLRELFKSKISENLKLLNFKITSDYFVTENINVSSVLAKLTKKKVYTVNNNASQVFENENLWNNVLKIPSYKGLTCLTISHNYPHKNLKIIPEILKTFPDLKIRFIVTLPEGSFKEYPKTTERLIYIDKVNINQVPILYKQTDIMFLPTLLECFSASYPEAMKMKVPILTSDLPFAHGLCGDAALYCNTLSIEDTVKALHKLEDKNLRFNLIERGLDRLKEFDSPEERTKKYIEILENI